MPKQKETTDKFSVAVSTKNLDKLFPIGEARRTPINKVTMLIILQGSAIIEVDDKDYLMHSGVLVTINQHHLVRLLSQTDNFLFNYLIYELDFLSDFPLLLKADIADYIGNNPLLPLCTEDFIVLQKYHELIADRYHKDKEHTAVIKGLLFSFILESNKLYSGRKVTVYSTRQDELTDRLFSLLHQHYLQQHSIAFYADRLCVSDKYLMQVVKRATGKSIHFWITDFLLRDAKLLLCSTSQSVTAIADELNFPNSSFFARFFREHTGMSPSEFRKSAKE